MMQLIQEGQIALLQSSVCMANIFGVPILGAQMKMI